MCNDVLQSIDGEQLPPHTIWLKHTVHCVESHQFSISVDILKQNPWIHFNSHTVHYKYC